MNLCGKSGLALHHFEMEFWSCKLFNLLSPIPQLEERPAKRGGSNSGWRQLDTMDRILLFYLQLRHGWPDQLLGVLFGVSDRTVSNYVDEVAIKIEEKFVPRLFYLPPASNVRECVPKDFVEQYPDVLLIGDATHIRVDTPELFSLNGLTFCVYKWGTTVQFVACKCALIWVASIMAYN